MTKNVTQGNRQPNLVDGASDRNIIKTLVIGPIKPMRWRYISRSEFNTMSREDRNILFLLLTWWVAHLRAGGPGFAESTFWVDLGAILWSFWAHFGDDFGAYLEGSFVMILKDHIWTWLLKSLHEGEVNEPREMIKISQLAQVQERISPSSLGEFRCRVA